MLNRGKYSNLFRELTIDGVEGFPLGDINLSLRRFRELICLCMTTAEQRDTADEIVAEFKFCLLTWDSG